jgi:hypothetical protein
MRYFLPLALLALAPLPAGAVTSAQPSCDQADQQVAQSRCFQVADYFPPDMTRCQKVGQTQLGIPIWLCC